MTPKLALCTFILTQKADFKAKPILLITKNGWLDCPISLLLFGLVFYQIFKCLAINILSNKCFKVSLLFPITINSTICRQSYNFLTLTYLGSIFKLLNQYILLLERPLRQKPAKQTPSFYWSIPQNRLYYWTSLSSKEQNSNT